MASREDSQQALGVAPIQAGPVLLGRTDITHKLGEEEHVEAQSGSSSSTLAPADADMQIAAPQEDSQQALEVAPLQVDTQGWQLPDAATMVQLMLKLFLLTIFTFALFLATMPSCFDFEKPLSRACVHPVLPRGPLFSLLLIVLFGNVAGKIVQNYAKLPGLLGMLAVGYVLRNFVPLAMDGLSPQTNSTLRTMALGMIMVMAGMGLDLAKLREQLGSLAALSSVPCVSEAIVIAVISPLVFPQMNVAWGLMLGFVIADVSPAVLTPLPLFLQSEGYGVEKGIPSILMAGGSINSVLAIVLYSVAWVFAWGDDVEGTAIITLVLVKLLCQIFLVGLLGGWLQGCILSRVWSICPSDALRFCLVACATMCNLFGFAKLGMGGGGCLAALSLGAGLQHSVTKHGFVDTDKVQEIITEIWSKLGQVLLFTLLGASVDQSKLNPPLVACGALTVLVGLVGRACATRVSCICLRDWNAKEKAFAVVAWCPKATVQAALASRALDYVQERVAQGADKFVNDPDYVNVMMERSEVILTTAVLSIIMTAPVFAVLITVTGKRWLERKIPEDLDNPC